jgi:hypothetical protein
MANTNFTVNDPLAVKLWAKKLAVQAIQQTWFRNFISDDGNNVITMLDDAEKSAGDTVNVGLCTQLAGSSTNCAATRCRPTAATQATTRRRRRPGSSITAWGEVLQ